MWTLQSRNKWTSITKQKQRCRHREHTGDCQRGRGRVGRREGEKKKRPNFYLQNKRVTGVEMDSKRIFLNHFYFAMYKVVWEYLHTHKHTHTQHINEREILWSETKQVTQLLWDEIVKSWMSLHSGFPISKRWERNQVLRELSMCDQRMQTNIPVKTVVFFWIQLQEEITKGIII